MFVAHKMDKIEINKAHKCKKYAMFMLTILGQHELSLYDIYKPDD